jgi:hypothetical protein
MSRTGLLTTDPPQVYQQVAAALRAATPALLFGLRLWIAVCLALYIAFWLQLENPSWAGASAAIVCQPNLGASLRKGWFRMIGTTTGAVAIVVLTACFPQNRLGFLLGLALWGGACGVMPEVRVATCSCSPSPAPAKSVSASSARASFSPGRISGARGDGWLSSSPGLPPKSPDG